MGEGITAGAVITTDQHGPIHIDTHVALVAGNLPGTSYALFSMKAGMGTELR